MGAYRAGRGRKGASLRNPLARLTLVALSLLLCLGLPGCSGMGEETPATATAANPETGFEAHFIDVGQGDCALILSGGHAMLVDGGPQPKGSLVVSYLRKAGVAYLDYIVCTHAHEDHVGGLTGVINAFAVGAILSPVDGYDSKAFGDFARHAGRKGLALTRPEPGDAYTLGEAAVTVLGPGAGGDGGNDDSIIILVEFGGFRMILTGDAERPAEAGVLELGVPISADLMKVGHHGSNTSTTYPFLREIMPEYAVISVGDGNDYGHPSENVMSRLYDAGVAVYRTDMHGSVVFRVDGGAVTVTAEKGGEPIPGRELAVGTVYVGNINSKVFHLETCPNLPAESNRIYFGSRGMAVESGYRPCGNCRP
ncbi:MAG: MBL fold metallo-hydrolase [Oscillospiraceae bacterium]|nr:MBL fold metallo-hydrolase [Oscillospiraceae bacterium]